MELRYVPLGCFHTVRSLDTARETRAELFAALCRINALYMVKRAGSGHLGTTFSCQDIVSWLLLNEVGPSDVFFSSKGHDVPAFYAAITGLDRLPLEKIHSLRRLGGLPGHPERRIPGFEANTGSLGMGISKAKGMVLAHRLKGVNSRVFVLTGDGELEEGQIWESLPSAVAAHMDELTVVVDHNKIQSDTWVRKVSAIGDYVSKFKAFGWHVEQCDGHDHTAMATTFDALKRVEGRPKVVIAHTLKGKGVSFMEEFGSDDLFYGFHSGAPTDEQYARALEELSLHLAKLCQTARVSLPELRTVEHDVPSSSPGPRQKLVDAYGRALVQQAQRDPLIVALDADLVKDCGLREFAERYPERFIECGIAEQDMVSQAGGLAMKGVLPIVHSFSCFLSARPNEQIYTNGLEGTKVVYVATLAGLLPATPGASHQSVRDISSLTAVPNLVMLAPATEPEVAAAVEWALRSSPESTYLRLSSIPCALPFEVDPSPRLDPGIGSVVREGADVALFAYGPVMISQAYEAATILERDGIGVRVINMPWLNRVDRPWLRGIVNGVSLIVTVDDHYVRGGQGEMLLSAMAEVGWPEGVRSLCLGLLEIPACGQNDEVLAHHRLDGRGIAEAVLSAVNHDIRDQRGA